VTAVKAGEVEGLLRRGPDPRIALLLVYGPDAGLVGERARKLAEGAVDDPADPFQLVRLEGDAVASDPGRLVDEATTVALFGGRRAVWIRAGQKNLQPAVEALLAGPAEARVVIEAGDLGKSAPLRAACERSPRALAIPCYADEGGGLAALVDDTLRAADLRIARDARQTLIASLGGDRLASRGEIEKLALYAHDKARGNGEVTLDDVDAVVSDVSGLALNALVDAAFGGRTAEVERAFRRFRAEGTSASTVLGSALRHGLQLLAARLGVEGGQSAAAAVAAWRGLHFRRQKAVEAQLARWRADALRDAVARLQEAVLACRRADPALEPALALDALLRVAGRVR
jgi:DNA polymerase III subunit delta